MAVQLQSAEEIADLLATVIAGGDKASWLTLIGPIERVPTWKYVRFNWRIDPAGVDDQREVICRAFDIVRSSYPYIV